MLRPVCAEYISLARSECAVSRTKFVEPSEIRAVRPARSPLSRSSGIAGTTSSEEHSHRRNRVLRRPRCTSKRVKPVPFLMYEIGHDPISDRHRSIGILVELITVRHSSALSVKWEGVQARRSWHWRLDLRLAHSFELRKCRLDRFFDWKALHARCPQEAIEAFCPSQYVLPILGRGNRTAMSEDQSLFS